MGFLEKVCDSRGCVTHGGSVRVSDAESAVAVYRDLYDALSYNGIKYSLDDFRIWSEELIINDSDGRYTLILYADGFVEDGEAEFDYSDAFYSDTILHNWGIRIFHNGEFVVEFYGTDPTEVQAKSLADILGHISEEDLSYETAVNEIKMALSVAGITYSTRTKDGTVVKAKPVMDFIEKVCGSQGCAGGEKVSDSRSVEYRVMLSDCKDSEGLPISVSILVDSDDVEVFEDYLRREEGNSYGHAFGGSVEY